MTKNVLYAQMFLLGTLDKKNKKTSSYYQMWTKAAQPWREDFLDPDFPFLLSNWSPCPDFGKQSTLFYSKSVSIVTDKSSYNDSSCVTFF